VTYEINLDNDFDRGLDRYTITLGEDFDSASAHELCDWLTAAAQNPTAMFTIDVSDAGRPGSRPVATVLARCAWLRTRRRVEVVRRGLTSRTVALGVGGAEALLPML
jgi:hypothetical protein